MLYSLLLASHPSTLQPQYLGVYVVIAPLQIVHFPDKITMTEIYSPFNDIGSPAYRCKEFIYCVSDVPMFVMWKPYCIWRLFVSRFFIVNITFKHSYYAFLLFFIAYDRKITYVQAMYPHTNGYMVTRDGHQQRLWGFYCYQNNVPCMRIICGMYSFVFLPRWLLDTETTRDADLTWS